MSMENKSNFAAGICGGSIILGAIGAVFGIIAVHKMNKMAKKVGKAVDDIADETEVKISESIVEQAVNKAVEEEAADCVHDAMKRAREDVASTMRVEIKKEIDAIYGDLRGKLTDEVDRQVQNISVRDIEREATSKAEQRAFKRFDEAIDGIAKKLESTYVGKLDVILNRYDSRMKDVDEIYAHINARQKGSV